MSRKVGSGNVVVNGKVMTTQMYQEVVENALIHNGNNWMSVGQIVLWGSTNKMCEKKDAPRRAMTHPMWKIVSTMGDKLLRIRKNGVYMYKLRNPKEVYINGEPYMVQ